MCKNVSLNFAKRFDIIVPFTVWATHEYHQERLLYRTFAIKSPPDIQLNTVKNGLQYRTSVLLPLPLRGKMDCYIVPLHVSPATQR